jgi:apolipoprotein D and lipocalin family protein
MISILIALWTAWTPASTEAEVRAVDSLDLERYAGRFYEIARLPNRFQERCARDVTATYTVRGDGKVTVVNECETEEGARLRAEGEAKRAHPDRAVAELKVRFAPRVLSFLPFVWGDYWVLDLTPDYSLALVGEPRRRYLWVLSRTPRIDDESYQRLVSVAESMGYDVSRLVRTPQSGSEPDSP